MSDQLSIPAGHLRHAMLGTGELQALIAEVPLAAYLGCRVETLDHGSATLRLPYRTELLRPGGTIGGPAMMTLADVAIWGAVLSMIGPMALAVTTDLTFHFLRKPAPGDLLAHARTLQLGRRLAIADCTITGATDPRTLAHAVGTYALPEQASVPAAS
jgi:uncharacterized protein (TIGR00369 family)